MKLSEKIQEALRQQQEINLSDPVVQKRLAAQWGYVPADAQPAPSTQEGWKDCDALRDELDALKAWKAEVEAQKPVGYWDPCDDMYFLPGFLLPHSEAKMEPRYACPVPAQSVPVAAIEKVLAEVMEIAVSNGASSVSMPDEYVEIAAWLHGLAAAPKQEVR